MKDLHGHNAAMDRAVSIQRRQCGLAGVLCPRCHTVEMVYRDGVVLMIDPPVMRVVCPECGLEGRKIV